jgi:putative transposase
MVTAVTVVTVGKPIPGRVPSLSKPGGDPEPPSASSKLKNGVRPVGKRGQTRVRHQESRSEHFLVVCRYVERNAAGAGLVKRAEDWRWGSLWRWLPRPEPEPKLLSSWPIPRLPNWVDRVNEPLREKELEAVRRCAQRGCPLGEETWVESIARRLNLESTMRPRGRPRTRPHGKNSRKEA